MLLGLALGAPVARAEGPMLGVSLEAGAELDSNPARETAVADAAYDPVPAVVARAGLRLSLGWRPAPRTALRASAALAAKKYAGYDAVADEDVAVLASDVRLDRRLADRPLVLGLRGSYYDAFERDTDADQPEHDFRTGLGLLSLTLLGDDAQRVTLAVGWRAFAYKPDGRYDFAGEQVQLGWRRTFGVAEDDVAEDDTWEVAVDATFASRRYADVARVNGCAPDAPLGAGCLAATDRDRADLVSGGSVEVAWSGALLVSGRYDVTAILSNSFGQSLVRHRVEVAATVEAWWSIVATGRAVVQVNQFLDPLLLSRDIGALTIDGEENRNAVTLHLSRELGDHLTVEARGSLYANELATQELRFRRQTAYLGLVWRL
jgi:hypothetical protein